MSPTVHELRNRIRSHVGRFEREVDAQFTKEELRAIADALDADVGDGRPSKRAMRAAIRKRAGVDADDEGGAFRKADLTAIAARLDES